VPSLPGRLARSLQDAWPALAAYAAVRFTGLVMLTLFSNRSLTYDLTLYDTTWFLGIARHGYDTSIAYHGDQLVNTNIAFFPLYPGLIKIGYAVGLPLTGWAILLSWFFGLVAAWGIFAVGRLVATSIGFAYPARFGAVLAVLWGVIPHAVVESMAYTETLFTALCAWTLYAILERKWLLAGVLTFLAGLTRPTAIALIATLGLACLVAIIRRQDSWRPWVAAIASPLGLIGFIAWCGYALGRKDAYFWMQDKGWKTTFDWGRGTVHELHIVATKSSQLAYYVTTFVVFVALVLLILVVLNRRIPWPVAVFSFAMLALVVLQGGSYYHAKGRFLIPAFTLLIPIAIVLAERSLRSRIVVLSAAALMSGWYGVYLLTIWTRSP
jgi:Gpi18-like mannosyltransferase